MPRPRAAYLKVRPEVGGARVEGGGSTVVWGFVGAAVVRVVVVERRRKMAALRRDVEDNILCGGDVGRSVYVCKIRYSEGVRRSWR